MEFAYLLRPAFDEDFRASATDAQLRVLDEHRQWLLARHAEGAVRYAGRGDPGPFALVVLSAADEPAARRLMEADPSVRAGVQTAELVPFRTFLPVGDT